MAIGTALSDGGARSSGAASGGAPDDRAAPLPQACAMPVFLLHHEHEPHECAAAFAAWTGFESPLRHGTVEATCLTGGHALCRVQAPHRASAPAQPPRFVPARTTSTEI